MRLVSSLLFITLFGWCASAQVTPKDSIPSDLNPSEQDSIMEVMLDEVYIGKQPLNYADKKEFLILQNRVYKVYPYARIASERLTMLDRNMSKLKTAKEKKKYYKIVEDYIENEFSEKLKKLSRKQGQILIKLIYRQTGRTTYSIIKDYKSGWKAFWSNSTAKVFDLDLKRGYDPYQVNEDYLIETILVRAFESGRLQKQEAAKPVDMDELDKYWLSKAIEQAKQKN
ncbi:DUF4294 domain-containing protein [Flavobacterium sp. MAH-1]|uniref:DUF4294 domain-containing protein n=1 Tax=Flavobacterium agri TaxID=2743471 RepID=A0A7Y9C7G5_9FLAO|nr:DUF4294 domain-containing protein [Flavobacterium agri]NUY82340.1 DUF4294 domain-containing protein [Flavobacterium agri]NYA72364.1 DUF4294 domain-containing protein [Flavobacterium agri]